MADQCVLLKVLQVLFCVQGDSFMCINLKLNHSFSAKVNSWMDILFTSARKKHVFSVPFGFGILANIHEKTKF